MKIILEDQGIQLIERDARYYLRYDEGELMVRMREIQITEEEAERIRVLPEVAYDIILKYQDRESGRFK